MQSPCQSERAAVDFLGQQLLRILNMGKMSYNNCSLLLCEGSHNTQVHPITVAWPTTTFFQICDFEISSAPARSTMAIARGESSALKLHRPLLITFLNVACDPNPWLYLSINRAWRFTSFQNSNERGATFVSGLTGFTKCSQMGAFIYDSHTQPLWLQCTIS